MCPAERRRSDSCLRRVHVSIDVCLRKMTVIVGSAKLERERDRSRILFPVTLIPVSQFRAVVVGWYSSTLDLTTSNLSLY